MEYACSGSGNDDDSKSKTGFPREIIDAKTMMFVQYART